MLAAKIDDRAVHQHHLDAQEIVGRHAIFQTVGTAGIHGDVAAYGAGELRARVGSIEITLWPDRIGNGQVGDPRLHGGRAIGKVDFENSRHLRQADDDRVLCGMAPPHKEVPAPRGTTGTP